MSNINNDSLDYSNFHPYDLSYEAFDHSYDTFNHCSYEAFDHSYEAVDHSHEAFDHSHEAFKSESTGAVVSVYRVFCLSPKSEPYERTLTSWRRQIA